MSHSDYEESPRVINNTEFENGLKSISRVFNLTEDTNTELPGKQASEESTTPPKATSAPEKAKQDDEKPREDDKILTKTQAEFNKMMGTARSEGRDTAKKELKTLTEQLEAVTKERDTYRTAEVAKVKEQFDKLPEDVRTMAPFNVDKITEGDTFAQATAWLPKAEALAVKLSGKQAESSTPPPAKEKEKEKETPPPPAGNSPGPNPQGKKDPVAEQIEKAKQDMLRRF